MGKPVAGGAAAPGKPKSNSSSDRIALGLTALKPSEMIAGLEEAAKRAENLELREAARRKSGGSTLNEAMHIDDTGRKWKRMVNLAIVAGVLLALGAGGVLMYMHSRKGNETPRELLADTLAMLRDLGSHGAKMKLFKPGETVAVAQAKEHLLKSINNDLEDILAEINKGRGVDKTGKATNPFFMPDKKTVAVRDSLIRLKEFKDAWGAPFLFEMGDPDTLKITATTKISSGGLQPELINVRGVEEKLKEKEEKKSAEK